MFRLESVTQTNYVHLSVINGMISYCGAVTVNARTKCIIVIAETCVLLLGTWMQSVFFFFFYGSQHQQHLNILYNFLFPQIHEMEDAFQHDGAISHFENFAWYISRGVMDWTNWFFKICAISGKESMSIILNILAWEWAKIEFHYDMWCAVPLMAHT